MNTVFLQRLTRLSILLFFQVLVFNHIHLLGYITPLVLGYMIACFHRNSSRNSILLWAFSAGLLNDMFSNTAGMAAASCTLAAMMQPLLLGMFTPYNSAEDLTPTFRTLGFWKYVTYITLLMFVLHVAYYALDAFTLRDWPLTLLSIAGATLLTTIIIVFIELFVHPRKQGQVPN